MKRYYYICFVFLIAFNAKSQLLFYQDTYKGGVTSDGRTYLGYDGLQPDTINFQLHVPIGATIRKAFLISKGMLWYGNTYSKDSPLHVNFNGNTIVVDSSSRITNFYYTGGDFVWATQNDVTNYVQNSNNKLIIPCQSCLINTDTSRHFAYDGFLLIVMYEKPSLPTVNPVIFLNNTPYWIRINCSMPITSG